jgi:ATP-binding cassette subfamily B protein
VNTADAGVGAADYALRRREQAMREPIDACITAVEKNANKMARVSNRSSPLMETLGGFAIVGGLMYGGYSVVAMGAQPGQFFSFLTAFLLAYEPAKRLGGSISN